MAHINPSGLTTHQLPPPCLDISFVQASINFCQDNHGDPCSPSSQHVEGLNLLDCNYMRVVQITEPAPYLALSHVSAQKNEPAVFEKYEHGSFILERLPPTIHDAVVVTRMLAYRYLWVEQLCVDQGDEAEREHLRSTQLSWIYAEADLTLVAAAGADANFGLPGVGPERRPAMTEVEKLEWATGALTMQEGGEVTSRRSLSFARTEATFRCSKCTIPESLYLAEVRMDV